MLTDKIFSTEERKIIRVDMIRMAFLALVCGLIWCAVFNRWTLESWRTPVDYISPQQDVLIMLAWIKASGDGHFYPLSYSNVPELGAPYDGNWNDFPVPEKSIFVILGWLSKIVGLFAAANLGLMAGQILAALSFYLACRLLRISWLWAFAGGIIFGFSRFAFAHGLGHINVVYYWQIPLGLVIVQWIASGDGIKFKDKRFVFALAVAFVTGAQEIYYTCLFAQFVLLAGVIQGWRNGWRKIFPAMAILATAMITVALMNISSVAYAMIHGQNALAVARTYATLEQYALKFVDLMIPPPDHRMPSFANLGFTHLKEAYLPVGESPPTAYIGVLGIIALTWLVLLSVRNVINNIRPPVELWLILWIFASGGVGGINGFIGAFGIYLIRATTRYSIFVVCILLMFAAARLSLMQARWKYTPHLAAFLFVIIALWDQTPPWTSTKSIKVIAQDTEWDRSFTGQMEKLLPPNAMVFQLPVIDFPETQEPDVKSYENFRPYFFAHQLRFSFGSDKGRPRDAWQRQLLQLKPSEAISQLESYGFGAIYINRRWQPTHGEEYLTALHEMGLDEKIEDGRGDLVCVLLKPSPHPILPPITETR